MSAQPSLLIVHGGDAERDALCRQLQAQGYDVSLAADADAALALLASHGAIDGFGIADPLTGLPNRRFFEQLLERAIKRCDRRERYLFALLVLGLDRFKTVNEGFGRPAADRLLVAVARRLNASLRSTDTVSRAEDGFTLARLAGDEFTVLLDDINDASDAMRVAERLREALQKPFEVEGQLMFASASVGIAVSSTGYTRPDDILRDATIALQRAKTDGGSKCELFDPHMRERAVGRLQVETELRAAVETAGFEVYYQPIISIETGEIAAFEALVRWRHQSRGLLAPAEFIAVAEDTGMILQIGRLVLAEACRQMALWRQRFGTMAPGLMCVNVSSRQFADAEFADHLEYVLRRTRLDASCLKLEITESAFLRDLPAAEATLARVHALGVRWSLDDFGTGYSSLSYLHMLPVATLKVDRTFVAGITSAGKGTEMVRAIVTLSHNLGMDVVAEGVETPDQLLELSRLGCEYAQGFYFSKPADAETAALLIGAQPWRGAGNGLCSGSRHADDAGRDAVRTEAGC